MRTEENGRLAWRITVEQGPTNLGLIGTGITHGNM